MIPGNSGFQVEIGTGPRKGWVIKRAKKYSDAQRLDRQMQKQIAHWKHKVLDGVNVPFCERVSWDAWAITQIDGIHIFEIQDRAQQLEAFTRLLDLVTRFAAMGSKAWVMQGVLLKKKNEMLQVCKSNHSEIHPQLKSKAQNLIEEIFRVLSKKAEHTPLLYGECHGDLTLGNVMFDRQGNAWIFDFLDTFINSPIMDLVKLRQDTRGSWTWKAAGLPGDGVEFHAPFDAMLMDYVRKRSWAREWFPGMSALNLARVFQYSRKEEELARLIALAQEELCLTF